MSQRQTLMQQLDRIEKLLAELVELKRTEPRKKKSKATEVTQGDKIIAKLIGVYIQQWQKRWETTGRPDVGPKARSCLMRLAKEMNPNYLAELIQVYCQMDNEWFRKKKHDLVTLETNINVVALARSKGDETEINWGKIFGGRHGSEVLSEADKATHCLLSGGREELPE